MGNTIEESESSNENNAIIQNVHQNSTENHNACCTGAKLEAVKNVLPENLEDKILVEVLFSKINVQNDTNRKIQRAKSIIDCDRMLTQSELGQNRNIKYYRTFDCPSDVPKVRTYDTVLNI